MAGKRSEQPGNPHPVGKPFQKGKSGNPGGRPKIPDDVKEAARALTPVAIATLQEVCTDPDAPASARVTAAEALLNRAWGKPSQAVELSGKDGGAIDVNVTGSVVLARRIAFALSRAQSSQPDSGA
jgi:hypothetical protein